MSVEFVQAAKDRQSRDHAEVLVERQDARADSPGRGRDEDVRRRQDDAVAIEFPRELSRLQPQFVVRRHVHHHVHETLDRGSRFRRDHAARDFQPHHPARCKIEQFHTAQKLGRRIATARA